MMLHFPFALYPGLLFLPSTSICCDWNHQTKKWSLHLYCTFTSPSATVYGQVKLTMHSDANCVTQGCCAMSLDVCIARQPGVWQWNWKTRARIRVEKIIKNNRWLSHTKYPVEFRSRDFQCRDLLCRGWITLSKRMSDKRHIVWLK